MQKNRGHPHLFVKIIALLIGQTINQKDNCRVCSESLWVSFVVLAPGPPGKEFQMIRPFVNQSAKGGERGLIGGVCSFMPISSSATVWVISAAAIAISGPHQQNLIFAHQHFPATP